MTDTDSRSRPLIALLTDFGTTDPYVGQMHAAIHRICPDARVVDLSHAIAPQQIDQAAWMLWTTVDHLPAGSVVCAVVDPGVGSQRTIIAIDAGPLRFVGPDNGLFGWLCDDFPGWPTRLGLKQVVAVENERYFGPARSHTFHGRDIMSPVAAHIAAGVPLGELGTAHGPPAACDGLYPRLRDRDDGTRVAEGRVIHIDHFGNLITNVPAREVPGSWTLRIGDHDPVTGPVQTFADVGIGDPLVYAGSGGFIELAVNRGHAAARWNARTGTPIHITGTPPSSAPHRERSVFDA